MHNSNQYWWVLCRKFLLLLSWNVRVLGHKGKLFYPKLFNMGPLLCLLTHWVIHSCGWLTTHGHNTQYFIMPWSDYQCFSTEPAKKLPTTPQNLQKYANELVYWLKLTASGYQCLCIHNQAKSPTSTPKSLQICKWAGVSSQSSPPQGR